MRKINIPPLMIIGIMLLVLSTIVEAMILAVPFMSFSIAIKTGIISAMLITGNVLWWIGVPLVGKEVVAKYKKYLNPRTWTFLQKKTL